MPTEHEIAAAGPLSTDDPGVQAALRKMSRGMQQVVMRVMERARRTAAERPPADPPPEDKNGAGAPTKRRRPSTSSSTEPTTPTKERRPLCMPPS
jgi:hypothetical protein